MKKSSSFNVLLSEGALQNRWRQNAGASFIRIRKNKFRSSFLYLIALILIGLIVYITVPANRQHHYFTNYRHLQQPSSQNLLSQSAPEVPYNSKYPLSSPIVNVHDKTTTYKIGLIADLDTNSKGKKSHEYVSYFKKGLVSIASTHTSFDFKWEVESKEISSGYALKGKHFNLTSH
jgi:hypothetical protein